MRNWLYQNEWPWPLFRDRLRSCQPLRHIRHWISSKPLEIEPWFQRTINRKWPMGIKWSRDRWHKVAPKGQTHDPNTLRAQHLENSWRCYSARIANYYRQSAVRQYGRRRTAILATAWLLVKYINDFPTSNTSPTTHAVTVMCCIHL